MVCLGSPDVEFILAAPNHNKICVAPGFMQHSGSPYGQLILAAPNKNKIRVQPAFMVCLGSSYGGPISAAPTKTRYVFNLDLWYVGVALMGAH